MNNPENIKRFKRDEGDINPESHKVRDWRWLGETDTFGEFISRLWNLFGPPDEIGFEGFTYKIKDNCSAVNYLTTKYTKHTKKMIEKERNQPKMCNKFVSHKKFRIFRICTPWMHPQGCQLFRCVVRG